MRWNWDETLPQSSSDRSTLDSAAHRATSELAAAPEDNKSTQRAQISDKAANYPHITRIPHLESQYGSPPIIQIAIRWCFFAPNVHRQSSFPSTQRAQISAKDG